MSADELNQEQLPEEQPDLDTLRTKVGMWMGGVTFGFGLFVTAIILLLIYPRPQFVFSLLASLVVQAFVVSMLVPHYLSYKEALAKKRTHDS